MSLIYFFSPKKFTLTNSLGRNIEKTYKVNTKSYLLFLHSQKYHVDKTKGNAHTWLRWLRLWVETRLKKCFAISCCMQASIKRILIQKLTDTVSKLRLHILSNKCLLVGLLDTLAGCYMQITHWITDTSLIAI